MYKKIYESWIAKVAIAIVVSAAIMLTLHKFMLLRGFDISTVASVGIGAIALYLQIANTSETRVSESESRVRDYIENLIDDQNDFLCDRINKAESRSSEDYVSIRRSFEDMQVDYQIMNVVVKSHDLKDVTDDISLLKAEVKVVHIMLVRDLGLKTGD